MEVDDNAYCIFRWDIQNPFIPWRKCFAEFYDGTHNGVAWSVIIEPTGRNINHFKFRFHLFCPHVIKQVYEVGTIRTVITYNSLDVEDYRSSEVSVQPGNNYSYRFETSIEKRPRRNDVLHVLITFALPGQIERNLMRYRGEKWDAFRLSDDLLKILIDPVYSNMKLKSNDSVVFEAHSYIIRARWNDFFKIHNIPTPHIVEINANKDLLEELLFYIYSSRLRDGWPYWIDASYVSQLFHVIYFYSLYHLYRVLVNNDKVQKRLTERTCFTRSMSIRCHDLLYKSNRAREEFTIAPTEKNTKFIFEINVKENNGLWLTYSLQSLGRNIVFVQVKLDLRKRVKIGSQDHYITRRVWSLHEKDHKLNPDEKIISKEIFNLTCPQAFGNLYEACNGHQSEVYSISCTLRYTDGTEIDVICTTNGETQTDEERCSILCDHMQTLVRKKFPDADLKVKAPQGGTVYGTYKAIFATRVPHWQAVIEPVDINRQPPVLPDVGTLSLSDEAIPEVLSYICSGRALIPNHLLFASEDFAMRGRCQSLQDFVDRARPVRRRN